ncbi:MAG: 4-hydroxy-tetrahydrodipicolinate reductase [Lachnospiraceae bacterium]|nr:4-hydroxy-tetrahydrodipicolinate reductase [Lachnospiraceae bacterium]MDY5742757.1 4-hydroxy-tetrahydrodipicolinate reductase [Lachnospiraceae bacterium]
MRIIVNGAAGHMGQLVCKKIEGSREAGGIAVRVDTKGGDGCITDIRQSGPADCIIDFSHHEGTRELLTYAMDQGLPLVLATTGHTDEERAQIQAAAKRIPLFFSANMSLGVAVLADLVKQAVAMFPEADIEIIEQHHSRKLDVPSGTALLLARAVRESRPQATLTIGRHRQGRREPDEIGIHSLRLGSVVGIHEVLIHTGSQVLTLKHEATDRGLFADGALAAAAFLVQQPAGLYQMDDLIQVGG